MSAFRVPVATLLLCIGCVACGKRGNPLPPLMRVPSAPGEFAVMRLDDDVYVRFTVPTTNADNVGPADVARIEIYALTADSEPAVEDLEELRDLATLVASEPVRRPAPSPPPQKEGVPPMPMPPPGPGVDQGATVVARETLTAEAARPVTVSDARSREGIEEEPARIGPLVAPADDGPRRYYFAVAVSPRGRYGPRTHLAPVPLGETSAAPPAPQIAVEEKAVTIRWKPSPDARAGAEPAAEGLLPSRSLVAGPPPTTYEVYEVRKDSPAGAVPWPTPITPQPVGALEFTHGDITLGEERCFIVRPVDVLSGLHVRGPASPVACDSFADRFAPAPPGRLDAVAATGGINLIWEPSASSDVAGYLVLRGEGANATLTPLTPEPIAKTAHNDTTAAPGVLYTYAVVAVDKAGNRSPESNRVEETGRQ